MTTTTVATEAPGDEGLRVALAPRTRPTPPGALSASLTFGWRALLKIKHVPQQLLDVTMFPIMFTLLFTFLFGGAIAGSPSEYAQFAIPGILVQTVAFITMYTGVALNTDIQKGIFDRFRSLPIWRTSALAGALIADVARYTFAALVVFVLGVALGFRPEGGVVGVLAAMLLMLLFAFSLTTIWTIFGLTLRTPESVMQTSIMILFPLVFTTNIWVETETMPGWLQAVVKANPVSRVVTAVRELMAGTASVSEIGWALMACAAIVAIFAPITMHLYARER
jgi:ABC-2 type transport system permease protein